MKMRLEFFVFAVLPCIAIAAQIVVPPFPVSPYADTEVSTNLAFQYGYKDVRGLEIGFAIEGCESNCVQVAFGNDGNGNGVLEPEETDTLYGWRNGRYFAESADSGLRIEESPYGDATGGRFSLYFRISTDYGLQHFAATNGLGIPIFTNLSASAKWLYNPGWNMMRVTRRGPGIPAEWFWCDMQHFFFCIILR